DALRIWNGISRLNGASQPPKNNVTIKAEISTTLTYSATKNIPTSYRRIRHDNLQPVLVLLLVGQMDDDASPQHPQPRRSGSQGTEAPRTRHHDVLQRFHACRMSRQLPPHPSARSTGTPHKKWSEPQNVNHRARRICSWMTSNRTVLHRLQYLPLPE